MDYTIGKLQRTTFLDERGRAVDGYRVYYTMKNGIVDYVEIEKAQYNGENVKAAIEKDIQTHSEVVAV